MSNNDQNKVNLRQGIPPKGSGIEVSLYIRGSRCTFNLPEYLAMGTHDIDEEAAREGLAIDTERKRWR